MDLTLDDVAELLNVTPRTISKWIKAKEIPFYEINNEVRFDPLEIEKWILFRDEGKEGEKGANQQGHQQFSLYRALNRGGILKNIVGHDKEQVIIHSVAALAPGLQIDPIILGELLLDRERLMPTALNYGFGIPHAREIIKHGIIDSVAIVFLEEPIEYGAMDNQPVHTLFFLFASQEKRHLHLLSKIALLISSQDNRTFLSTRPSKDELFPWLLRWEGQLIG